VTSLTGYLDYENQFGSDSAVPTVATNQGEADILGLEFNIDFEL
jgi:hypothetical protein